MSEIVSTDSPVEVGNASRTTAAAWRVNIEVEATLPPRAWLAQIRPGIVRAWVGRSVRVDANGLFEGTWAGSSGLATVPYAATVFGSGLIVEEARLLVVPPSHTLEPIYHARAADGSLIVANTFAGVLHRIGAELRSDVGYPLLFGMINRGLSHAATEIPTSGSPVTVHYFENIAVLPDASLDISPKPREPAFQSFDEYRALLVSSLASAFANAPDHEPLATISSGYDSTASAAVGTLAGCRRTLTFTSGWAWQGFDGTADSGERAASALGLDLQTFDRLAYLAAADAPEAEFLATGMSAEDVVYRSMERALPRSILLTGFWGGAAWRNSERPGLSRLDLSGTSLGEIRLRSDFIHIPVPFIGGVHQPTLRRLLELPEMRPFRMDGNYDEPIPRRLAEEAGVPRGSFAVAKMATSVRLHTDGLAAMSKSGRASFEDFCRSEAPGALAHLPRRRSIGRRGRLALRVAHSVGAERMTRSIVRRRLESVHIEPVLGSLLLRWSVAQVRDRYRSVSSA